MLKEAENNIAIRISLIMTSQHWLTCVGPIKKSPVKQCLQDVKYLIGDLVRIQTWDLLSRNQVLYSAELRSHI